MEGLEVRLDDIAQRVYQLERDALSANSIASRQAEQIKHLCEKVDELVTSQKSLTDQIQRYFAVEVSKHAKWSRKVIYAVLLALLSASGVGVGVKLANQFPAQNAGSQDAQ